tara:strand:+ start:584 stop:859 length:276 start_codon:yes stop_codon:yes gene_type:complete
MFGFLTKNDLTAAQVEFDRRVSALETASAQSVLRCEELHEMASRLIKRFETRQQRAKEKESDWPDDDQPGGLDATTARVMARRGNGRFNAI